MVQVRPERINQFRRDAWLEINLSHLESNLQILYQNSKRPLIPVLKADAYGHGAAVLANILDTYDFVQGYAVASLDEALSLREACSKPIMILGICPSWSFASALDHDIALTIVDLDAALKLNEIAASQNKQAQIHIKIDSGMNRIGFKAEDFKNSIAIISSLPNLKIKSIFSHLSNPADHDLSRKQIKVFEDSTQGLAYPRHIASSKAARELPESRFDLVRCGIELYGLECDQTQPLMSLSSRISFVKKIEAGEHVSYGGTWTAKHKTKIATLPLGYADGVPRALSNKIYATSKADPIQKFKQVGVITMDQMMFDIGDSDLQVGDTLELIGKHLPLSNWLEHLDTISYELVTNLNLRLPKSYTR